MCIQMMRHVFEQSGIKGAIAAVAKLPDNAVSFFEMYDDNLNGWPLTFPFIFFINKTNTVCCNGT